MIYGSLRGLRFRQPKDSFMRIFRKINYVVGRVFARICFHCDRSTRNKDSRTKSRILRTDTNVIFMNGKQTESDLSGKGRSTSPKPDINSYKYH